MTNHNKPASHQSDRDIGAPDDESAAEGHNGNRMANENARQKSAAPLPDREKRQRAR